MDELITNLILLCAEHHRAAQDGRFTVVLHAPGTISIRARRQGDPYYEIRPEPPPGKQPKLMDLLATAARHLRSA